MSATCHEGHYCAERIPVTTNVFNIPERLKEIDPRFFVMFNKVEQQYEVHVEGQLGGTLGCVLPFEELDARAIEYVQARTQQHFDEMAKQIDVHNEKMVKAREEASLDKACYKTKQAFLWDDHHPSGEGDFPEELIAE